MNIKKALFFVCITKALFALPVDNPIAPSLAYNGVVCRAHYALFGDPLIHCYQAWSCRAGFYGNNTFNRHLINKRFGRSNIDHFSMNTYATEVVFNIYDMLDLFATFGISDYYFKTSGRSVGALNPNNIIQAFSDSSFSYSLGFRYVIIEFANMVLGLQTQFFKMKAAVTKFQEGAQAIYPSGLDSLYSEWQYGIAFGYRLTSLYPYVGIKFSKVWMNFDNYQINDSIVLNRFHQSKHIGYAVGASLLDCDKAFFTIEGIFGDEKSLYYGAQLRF